MVSSEVEPILLYAFQKKCALHFVATPKLCIYNKYLPQFWRQYFAFYVLELKKKRKKTLLRVMLPEYELDRNTSLFLK